MSDRIDALIPGTFVLDGEEVEFGHGETILQAATRAGHYIPHLCWHPEFGAAGSCRICTVKVNGRTGASCTVQAASGQEVESNTPELNGQRKTMLQMLFVEGNHFCPSCEKSGNCRLQATAYVMGMEGPHFEEFYPDRKVDASHPDMMLDLNRCILCGLCVRASEQADRKNVFAIGGHGIQTHLLVNSVSGRRQTVPPTFARPASSCTSVAALPPLSDSASLMPSLFPTRRVRHEFRFEQHLSGACAARAAQTQTGHGVARGMLWLPYVVSGYG